MSDAHTPVIIAARRTPIGRFLGGFGRVTAPELGAVAIGGAMKDAGLKAENSEITMRASVEVDLDVETGEKVLRFLDALEDLDDTQDVYSNANIPEEAYN